MMTVAVALAHAAPRHAPRRQLAHRLGRRVDEHAHDFLVGAPVAAAHRVLEVHVLVVALALDHVAERRPACRPARPSSASASRGTSDRMITSWPRRLAPIADAQAGEAAADDEDVGVDDLHDSYRWPAPAWRRAAASRSRCRDVALAVAGRVLDADLDVRGERGEAQDQEEHGQRPLERLQPPARRVGVATREPAPLDGEPIQADAAVQLDREQQQDVERPVAVRSRRGRPTRTDRSGRDA